jgi:hypothetical protein
VLCRISSALFFERPTRVCDIKRLVVMNTSLQRIKAWRSRRKLRSLQQWEQIRAKGKEWFVFRTALTFSLTVVGATHALDSFIDGIQSPISLSKLIFYLVGGIVAGIIGWNDMEDRYQTALNEARVKASPSGALPTHDSPSQITADSESK